MKAFLFRFGDSLSQALNVLLYWKRGTANHSVSADAYRFARDRTRRFIDGAFALYEQEHCKKAYLNDVARAYALIEEFERTRVEQV